MAAALALASLLTTDPGSIDSRLEDPDIVSAVATVAAAGALAWRRSRPAASYAVMVVGSLVVTLTDHYIGLLSVLMLFSLYSLAAHGRRRDGLIGLGVGVICFVGLALLDVPDLGTSVLLQSLALLVAAWALGDAIRWRRQAQREQLVAAVTEERLRIARELHDVVAHSMSLIAVQAGVGAHVIHTDPDAAEQSLEVIADTSRKALEQTRSMLGMLREDTEDGARPPTQGLDDLPGPGRRRTAVRPRRRAGPPGTSAELDAAASLTAYRDRAGVTDQRHQALGGRHGQVTVAATTDGARHRGDRSGSAAADRRARGQATAWSGSTNGSGWSAAPSSTASNGDGFRVHAVLPTGPSP